MENVEIGTKLAEVADLLEIQGENPFKVRAYRNAVRTIQNLTRPLREMVAEGADLEELPGIGHDMAAYITEMVGSGRLRRLETLERQLPATLVELMRVEGLGPKKAKRLWEELGVRSVDDLARVLASGEAERLKGFRRPRRAGARPRRAGGAEEADVFAAVGLPWIPPELREDRGEIEAARQGRLPRLVSLADVRGDLQTHSRWTDGHDTILAMALAAAELGYQYVAVTDHSRAVTVAGGLDEEKLEAQWKEIAAVRRKLRSRIHLFRGLEVDILRDGRLDLDDEQLARLDVVVASVYSSMRMSRKVMTDRVLRALEHPAVDILAHPTGRILNERVPYELDVEAVLRAAAQLDVAVELNAQPDRLDLSDVYVRRAKELGAKVAIDTDAHTAGTLAFMRYGVDQARRGWLEKEDVLNALPLRELQRWLGRRTARGAAKLGKRRRSAGARGHAASDP